MTKTPFPNKLSKLQNDVLIGSLLGDASLLMYKQNKNPSLSIERTLKDIEYLKYQFSIFKNICTPTREIYKYSKKEYNFAKFSTRSCPLLLEYFNNWYLSENNKNTKIVPKTIELNSIIIAIWFCDDGYLFKDKKGKLLTRFCTEGFVKEDVMLLQNLLINKYKKSFTISKTPSGYRIQARHHASMTLLSDIEKYIPESMQRKLKYWKS